MGDGRDIKTSKKQQRRMRGKDIYLKNKPHFGLGSFGFIVVRCRGGGGDPKEKTGGRKKQKNAVSVVVGRRKTSYFETRFEKKNGNNSVGKNESTGPMWS